MAASSSNTPFDWLAGGLFFGKNRTGCIESIDTSKDMSQLLTGVQTNLEALIASSSIPQQQSQPSMNGGATAMTPTPTNNNSSGNEEIDDPSKFLAARLSRVRVLLYDERKTTSQMQETRRYSPAVAGSALQCLTGQSLIDLMPNLLESLPLLPFESRKHVAAIFNYLLVCGLDGNDRHIYTQVMSHWRDFVAHFYERFMKTIVSSHNAGSDIALHFGSMYRSCLRHPLLYQQLVGTMNRVFDFVYPFLDTYVHLPNFDVSSDAMESLRLVFTAGGDLVVDEESKRAMAELAAEFLTRDYEETFGHRFGPRLLNESANYMVRRVALQILSAVLLTRSNYSVMIRYVASRSNLILIMKLLRDTSPHITLDAFHVFKVFVANPNKPEEVIRILQDNKVKLCQYLRTLHQEREGQDTQFRDEKALIIATIEEL
ncbi:hypothetical protein MPSEU_000950900 [Mayamaea pseudoterrestris]|nr:hypothetical protein MPSEU_000950900 [Mayamaea pseudoterrestris]